MQANTYTNKINKSFLKVWELHVAVSAHLYPITQKTEAESLSWRVSLVYVVRSHLKATTKSWAERASLFFLVNRLLAKICKCLVI